MNTYGLTLTKTCSMCPEQYEVFDQSGKEVGCMRLRWGVFRVEHNDEVVYSKGFNDRFAGCFPSEESRSFHLENALFAIHQRLQEPTEIAPGSPGTGPDDGKDPGDQNTTEGVLKAFEALTKPLP